jgi:K+-sensing histidine kinase KdpD
MRHTIVRARTDRHNGVGNSTEPQSPSRKLHAESPADWRWGGNRETQPGPGRAERTELVTKPWFRYGISLLVSGWALVGTYLLNSYMPQTPTPLLFAAVTLAARYGGLGPGLLSTFICAIYLSIILEDPVGTPSSGGSSLLHLAVFVLVSILVSTITERARRAEAQARADATRLSILADVSRSFTAAMPDHQATLQTAARQMGEALAAACVISLLSEDGQWLSQAAWHHRDRTALGILGKLYKSQQYPAHEGIAGRALREDRSIVIYTPMIPRKSGRSVGQRMLPFSITSLCTASRAFH